MAHSRRLLACSVSTLAVVAFSWGLKSGPVEAACVLTGTTTTCDGDLSTGVSFTDAVTETLLVNSLTADIGAKGFFYRNTGTVDLSVDFDLPAFMIDADAAGSGRTDLIGLHLFGNAGMDADITGPITVQVGLDENISAVSLITNHQNAIAFEALGDLDITQDGDVVINHANLTADSTFVTGVDIDQFHGFSVFSTAPEATPKNITLNRTGAFTLNGGDLAATSVDATGDNRTIVGNTSGVSNHVLYGITALGGGTLELVNIGDVTLNTGTRTAQASSVGGRAESVTGIPDAAGFALTQSIDGQTIFGRVDERFDSVLFRQTGNVTVNVEDVLIEAVSQTETGGPTSAAAVQQTDFFNTSYGLLLENGLLLDAQIVGDIAINGGTINATANALAGTDSARGLVTAYLGGTDVMGLRARSLGIFTEGNTLNDAMADITIEGNVTAVGTSIDADIAGSGLAVAPVSSFPPDPSGTPASISLLGGNGVGVLVQQFSDETTLSANVGNQSRSVETVDQIDLTLDGAISATGGDVTATIGGSNLSGRLQGGYASALGGDPMTLSGPTTTTFTATGGTADLSLTGSHGIMSVTGGQARAVIIDLQSDTDTSFDMDVTANGGAGSLSGDVAAGSRVDGGEAIGLDIGLDDTYFNSEYDGLSQTIKDQLAARQLFVTSDIVAKGGDAISDDADAVAIGGAATGIVVQSKATLQGSVAATGGTGTDRNGAVAGIDTTFAFLPGLLSLATPASTLRIEGSVVATGEGVDVAAAQAGDTFDVSETMSAGVRSASWGKTVTVVANGGSVTANGSFVHAIALAGEATVLVMESGSTVTATGANASGIEVRPFQDVTFAAKDEAQGSTADISIESGAVLTSQLGTGISDDGRRVGVSFSNTPYERTLETYVNQTSVDVAGTVSGGNGTAIDLGTGVDRLMLRSTANLTGLSTLGSGDDAFAFETGFTSTGQIDGGDDRDAIEFDVADATTRRFDIETDATQFINFEFVDKRGAGTLFLGGPSITTVGRPTELEVNGGTAIVDSDLTNLAVTVNSGGMFSTDNRVGDVMTTGTGRVQGVGGSSNFTNAGVLAPGNSIGVFTVNGDLVLDPAGTLEIEIAFDGTSDLVDVTGTTTVGGTLLVLGINYPTDYPTQQTYTVIESDGGVSGTFASVTDNLPDLDVMVTYNANTVEVGYNMAQSQSDKSVLSNSLQAGAAPGGLFSDLLDRRGRSAASGAGAPTGESFTVAYGGRDATVSPAGGGWGPGLASHAAWFATFGDFRDVDGSGAATGYEADTTGFAFGLDRTFTHEGATITAGLAFGHTWVDTDSGASSGKVDTWHIGAFGSVEQGRYLLSGSLSYGFQDHETKRVIPLGVAAPVTAEGDADGGVFAASATASYDVAPELAPGAPHKLRIAPLIGLDHVSAHRDGFTETGAGILNLTVDDDSFSRTALSIGFEVAGEYLASNGAILRPSLDARWEHGFGDKRAVTNSAIAGIAGAAFTSPGASEDRDRLRLEAGLGIEFGSGHSANLHYAGSFSGGFESHTVGAKAIFKF